MIVDVGAAERAIDQAGLGELEVAYVALSLLVARIQVRLWCHGERGEKTTERWLSPGDAAEVLGESPRWMYTHWKEIPGACKPTGGHVRIPMSGLRRFMNRR